MDDDAAYEALTEADAARDAEALARLAWQLFADLGTARADLETARARLRTIRMIPV